MDLRQLQYLLAVVESGGFTRAASRLHVSQPAISLAIQQLEQRLGVRLLERRDRQVRTTPAGDRLVAHAREILSRVALAEQAARQGEAPEPQPIRIGVPVLIGSTWLPDVIAQFVEAHPDIRPTVLPMGAREVERRVAAGDIDVGIVSDYQASAHIELRHLFDAEMGVAMSADHPMATLVRVAWADFLVQPLVLLPRGYHQRERVEAEAVRRKRQLNVVAESDLLPVLKALLARGAGIGTLLTTSASASDSVVVRPFETPVLIKVSTCVRRGQEQLPPTRALLDYLGARR